MFSLAVMPSPRMRRTGCVARANSPDPGDSATPSPIRERIVSGGGVSECEDSQIKICPALQYLCTMLVNTQMAGHKRTSLDYMDGNGPNHGTRTKINTHRHGRSHEETSTTTQETHMDGHGRNHGTKTHAKPHKRHMGGTMVPVRRRGRRRRYTHIDMDETMERRARRHKKHTHG